MKTLAQHIQEAFQKINVTKEWMIDKYDDFNKMYFNNELPWSDEIELGIKSLSGSSLGLQGFKMTFWYSRDLMRYNRYVMRIKDYNGRLKEVENVVKEMQPYIYLSSKYDASENQWEDTLIHEMVHLYTYKDGLAPKQAHGPEFRAKCNQIRKIAKEKYGKDYELEIYAKKGGDYKLVEKEQKKIIEKNKRRNKSTIGIYLEIIDDRYPKRFLFTSRNNINNMIKFIKKYDRDVRAIYLSDNSYEKMCKEYGRFSISRQYRFFDVNEYPRALNYMRIGDNILDEDESMYEAKKEYVKPEMNVIEIDKDVNLSEINLEDILDLINKDNNDIEITGDSKIEKTIIDINNL